MALFQSSVVDKYLKTLDRTELEELFRKFSAYFHDPLVQENIRESKEEQFQEGFLINLFVNILGYSINPTPNYNLITENKNINDSKKADGAIKIGEKIKAVIELKGTNTTDLKKIESQAFGYKNNQSECIYVITSNFEKLRFYIDNAVDYEEFNLFKLTKKQFELLYLCLAYKNIEKGIPKKIKDESLSHEDKITKQLYQDYSLFKRQLHNDLVLQNPQYDALTLYKKSQKLLDRFLFLFFAEDRQLLPPNSVRLILNDWLELQERDVQIPLYDRYKKYFEYLNTGFKGKRYDVFAYNGGLFKTDEILDSVIIDDELLHKHTLKLSEYDFASEVDVNILGHIFENSLNELDEIKAQLEGQVIEKGKTKRKKDGVFYTPKYITKYIVENTVGKLCSEKRVELGIIEEEYTIDKKRQLKTKQVLIEKLAHYRDWLLKITICDPACGSGAFLNQALDFLISEHQYIDELQAKVSGATIIFSDVEKSILENNLFGVDLNEESVEIAKLSLWLRTAQPERKLNDLNNNIKCGNSLIDDPAVAGNKAFDWEKEFPHVFGYEVNSEVITTKSDELPDYLKLIKEKSLEAQTKAEQALALSQEAAELSKKVYEYAEKLEVVSEPNALYGVRKAGFDVVIGNPPYVNANELKKNLSSLEYDFLKANYVTAKGSVDLYIYFFEKGLSLLKKNGYLSYITPNRFLSASYGAALRENLIFNYKIVGLIDYSDKNVFPDASTYPVITLLRNMKDKNYDILTGKFNDTTKELIAKYMPSSKLEILDDYILGFLLNDKLKIAEKIISISESLTNVGKINATSTAKEADDYSALINENNGIKLINTGTIDPYMSNWGIDYLTDKGKKYNKPLLPIDNDIISKNRFSLYKSPKIIISKIGLQCEAYYDKLSEYASINTNCIHSFTDNYLPEYILCWLNSRLYNYLFECFFDGLRMSGGYLLYSAPNLKNTYIFKASIKDQQPFIEKADLMLSLNKELQTASQKFQRAIKRDFDLEDLSNKLQNWYMLTFKEFIEELGKKKIKLSKKDEFEWEDLFLQEQTKTIAIKSKLEATDKLIDRMVYTLYELTEEEIRIVEEG